MKKTFFIIYVYLFVFALFNYAADITITGKADRSLKRSISLANIRTDSSNGAVEFLNVLKNDLLLSGWFEETSPASASILISGDVRASSSGVSYNLNASWLAGTRTKKFIKSAPASSLRMNAHELSDKFTETFAENPGMASSKILFVGRKPNSKNPDIYVCDSDGLSAMQITRDSKLCLSPNWIPGENAFMYTSWLTGNPAVYKVNLNTNARELISSYPGMNQGAVVSPNKEWLALILSRSGGVDLYLKNSKDNQLKRLTKSKNCNESSPSWSPDGKQLAFVDDSRSAPQVKIMSLRELFAGVETGPAVYGFKESVAPEWSDDGRVVFCGKTSTHNRYGIYVMQPSANAKANAPKLVSPLDNADYEDPSWAPDNRHIVCTRIMNFKRQVVVIDTMGDPVRVLIELPGDWYLPAWSDKLIGR